MANKFVLNTAGVGEMLKSAEMMSVCEQYAQNMKGSLGDGYEIESTRTGTSRVAVTLRAVTTQAQQDNLDNNTLLKAVDS